MSTFSIVFLVVGLSACAWVLICNERTYRAKMGMTPRPGDKDFWVRMEATEAVTYSEHMWAMVFFRDPLKLYRPEAFRHD